MKNHTRDIRKSGRETTHTLTVTWPIEDTMQVNHGARPTITATVNVHIEPETTEVAA